MEQRGENLHGELNNAEKQLLSIKNWPVRYFLMIKEVENKLRVKKKCPELSDINNKFRKNSIQQLKCSVYCVWGFLSIKGLEDAQQDKQTLSSTSIIVLLKYSSQTLKSRLAHLLYNGGSHFFSRRFPKLTF